MSPATDFDLRTSEVADLLGVSTSTVLTYVSQGLLICRLLPSGHRRFRREDVEALIADGTAQAAS